MKRKRSPEQKITKNYRRKSLISLCHLPIEILEHILDYINIWHRNRIRETCKRLKNVCDVKLMHEFKSSLHYFGSLSRNGYEFNAMKVIEDATNIYVKVGFQSTLYGTMLPLMRNHYRNPFSPPIEKIKKFLGCFYLLVDEFLRKNSIQKANFLYILTLLQLLKQCKNCKILSTDMNVHDWTITFELKGSWLGVLWSSTYLQAHSFNFSEDQYDILLILCEIILAVNLGYSFKRVWEGSRKVFLCGHDTSDRKRIPRTILKLSINGTEKLINKFKLFYERNEIDWSVLPNDEFDLSINIICREALKWGCTDNYILDMWKNTHNVQSDDNRDV